MWAKIKLAYQIYLLLRAVWPYVDKIITEVELAFKDKEATADTDTLKLNAGVIKLKQAVGQATGKKLSTPEAQTALNAELIRRQNREKGTRR